MTWNSSLTSGSRRHGKKMSYFTQFSPGVIFCLSTEQTEENEQKLQVQKLDTNQIFTFY